MGGAKRRKKEGAEIRGMLGTKCSDPELASQRVVWGFHIVSFWDKDCCPSVTQQDGGPDRPDCERG